MALIFVPKIVFIRKHAHDPREKEDDEQENKEQEKQYKTILKDNENMQEKIKEVIKNVVIANVEGWPNNLVGLSKKKAVDWAVLASPLYVYETGASKKERKSSIAWLLKMVA